MNYLLHRLKEPSTWAGLAAIASAVCPPLGVATAATTAIVAGLGAVGVLVKERGSK